MNEEATRSFLGLDADGSESDEIVPVGVKARSGSAATDQPVEVS
jgi:hypothetical protein